MGKVAIVKSSQLHGCWSAKRYVDECEVCDRVANCKLPESKRGRLRIAERALDHWVEGKRKAEAEVERLKKELEG